MNNDRVPLKIESISELHQLMHMTKPKHPLLSLMDNCQIEPDEKLQKLSFTMGFYVISYKEAIAGKMGYGQGYYDFDEGGMMENLRQDILFCQLGYLAYLSGLNHIHAVKTDGNELNMWRGGQLVSQKRIEIGRLPMHTAQFRLTPKMTKIRLI